MIGRALTDMLTERRYNVIILTRHLDKAPPSTPTVRYAAWDPEKGTIDAAALAQADYICNLAGAGIADERWSRKRKQEIVESRLNASKTIVKALRELPHKVQVVVNASAIGWYGDDRRLKHKYGFKEKDPVAKDFLGETCRKWEESIDPVSELGIRVVKLRTGIVLSREGGALVEFMKPLQYGIAAILGMGRQMVSWIHITDICRMYVYSMENEECVGPFNAVASYPVDNKTLMLAIARRIRGKSFVPIHVPGFLIRIAVGGMSVEVLKSLTVDNQAFKDCGYHFLYPSLEPALNTLFPETKALPAMSKG